MSFATIQTFSLPACGGMGKVGGDTPDYLSPGQGARQRACWPLGTPAE